ncbi:MAG: hypothetical protein V1826_01655 [bacterium]
MSNIEFHSLDKDNDYAVMAQAVQAIATDAPELAADVVYTSAHGACHAVDAVNGKTTPAPFIRIYDSNAERLSRVAEVLLPLGLGIETVVLNKFYPAARVAAA